MTKAKSRFKYIGIDPGISVGIAVIDSRGKIKAYKCPSSSEEMSLLFQMCIGRTAPDNLRLFLNFNTPVSHGYPTEAWLKNKAPVFPDGTIFEEIDTHRSYIYDSDSGTTNTAKDFWTEIT